MAQKSGIEWTESTWNPVTGCDKISSGCANCYAERMAKQLQIVGQLKFHTSEHSRKLQHNKFFHHVCRPKETQSGSIRNRYTPHIIGILIESQFVL